MLMIPITSQIIQFVVFTEEIILETSPKNTSRLHQKQLTRKYNTSLEQAHCIPLYEYSLVSK